MIKNIQLKEQIKFLMKKKNKGSTDIKIELIKELRLLNENIKKSIE